MLSYFKKKEVEKIIQAEFIYLLYNQNTNAFERKEAKESRIINMTNLNNIDLVQSDFKEAIQNCVKLP